MTGKITKEYRFNEEEHVHQLFIDGEWKNLYGVSSVVKDIVNYSVAAYYGSRRALMALGYDPKDAKEAVEGAKQRLGELLALEDESLIKELYGAYTAHAKYSKERAKKGTNAHEVVDKWIKECIEKNNGKPADSEEPIIKKFRELTDRYEPKFVASEKHGYNKDLWIGGICDVVVDTNIGLGIWDNKNRSAIYEKDLIQMGLYSLLFPMDFTHVLGVPLEGEESRIWVNMEVIQRVAKAQLEVYKWTLSFVK